MLELSYVRFNLWAFQLTQLFLIKWTFELKFQICEIDRRSFSSNSNSTAPSELKIQKIKCR